MPKTADPANLEHIDCELCGENEEIELSTQDRDGNYLRTIICRSCGLVYTNPRPAVSEIEKYNERLYRLEYKGIIQPKKKHVFRAAKIAASRIRKIQDYIAPGMKALDIGSGGGEVVFALRDRGIRSVGLEPNVGYARYARQVLDLPVLIGCIENAELPRDSFDLVTMYHVIEHLHSPARALLNIHSCLKPGGTLIVECPNVEARCQAPSHRLHRAHLYNFNEAALRALVERAGFSAIKMLTFLTGKYPRDL